MATITPVWWAKLRRFMVLCGLASLLACQRTHSSEGPKRLVIYQEDAAQSKDLAPAEHRALGEDTGEHARYGRSGWRPFYRLVLNGDRAAQLEAWAEVTNRSGLDWRQVNLTLMTGSSPPAREPAASQELGVHAGQGHTDQDEDGIANLVDACSGSPEDFDGYEDDDGCPDPDNDHDRILDVVDQCPDESETYNGIEDDDGCPDKGGLPITEAAIAIAPKIYFERNDVVLNERARVILDAVAAQFAGNPTISLVELAGFFSSKERNYRGIGPQRALSVASYLVAAGVDPSRMQVRTLASIQAPGPNKSKDERANRRVEFRILQVKASKVAHKWRPHVGRALPRRTAPVLEKARVQEQLRVSLRDGETQRFALALTGTQGHEVYLYTSSPGQAERTMRLDRALLLSHASPPLVPGPLAVTLGDGVVRARVASVPKGDEHTLITFQSELRASVQVREQRGVSVVRILSIDEGRLMVEDAHEITTEYRLHPGLAPQRALYVRHLRHRDYVFTDAPQALRIRTFGPAALDKGNATIEVRESRTRKRSIALAEVGASELRSYAAGSSLPPFVRELLIALAEVSDAAKATETQMETLRRERMVAQLRGHEIWRLLRRSPSSRASKNELLELRTGSKELTKQLEKLTQLRSTQQQLLESFLRESGKLRLVL